MRIFKKILVYVLIGAAMAAFAGCDLPSVSDVENMVTYPEQYSITYEVESKDGSVTEIRKIVDGEGNVYFKSGTTELLYIKDGNQYTEYSKNEDGVFVKFEGSTYVQTYVEQQTKQFTDLAEMSRNQMMPTAKKSGDTQVLGRQCFVYTITVGGEKTGVHYSYYVDKETGICLGYESGMSAAGFDLGADSDVFRCTEFVTENIDSLKALSE
ncbi:MAG: hypothetical protein IJW70_03420 [Clostridia bacterium]|nr:hypothetical protein [Clostridia bacterium]